MTEFLDGGAILLVFLFWLAVVEGCVAAAAAGTLVNARGLGSMERELLAVYPLLLPMSFLILLLIPFVDSYPWAARPGIWLNKAFFIGRNLALLLLAYITARRFAFAAAAGSETKSARAAAYLFVFVASQSLAAYDLVMSLEYPWTSTLFGGYFFIESLYAGFAVSALLCVLFRGRRADGRTPEASSALPDIAVLMFGFSLLWAGLFFAQYLTIWYGNIPEEVSFIAKRVSASPIRQLSAAVLFLLFLIPFPALLATRAKSNRFVVSAVSLSVLSGIFLERFVFLSPAVHLHPETAAIAFAGLLVLFALTVSRGRRETSPEE